MKKKFSLHSLLLFGVFIFILSLIPNRSEAQTLTKVFSDDFESYTVGVSTTTLGYTNTYSSGGSSQVIASGTGANSSAKYVNMIGSNTGPSYNCYFIKSATVTAGQTYIFSVYTQSPLAKGYSVSYSSTALGNHSSGNLTNSTWQKQSYTFTATASETVAFTVYQWNIGNVYVDDISLYREQWTITASSSNALMGSVSGGGLKDPGTVSLTATPLSGYYFVNWTLNTSGGAVQSTSSTYTFTASADQTLVANFAAVASTLTVTGSLSPFSSTYGTAPTAQSFTVAGSSLTSDIVITPPSNFEISLSSGSGYQSTALTLTQASGSVSTTPIYVRLAATTAAGTYSAASLMINTTGNSQSVSCSGTVATIAPTLAFATSTFISKIIGDAAFTNAATSSNSAGAISYSSGNTAVATVNASTGAVTILTAGSTVITANIAANGNYNASSTTYTVNVYSVAIFRDNFDSYTAGNNLTAVTVPTYLGSYSTWTTIAVQSNCYLASKGAKLTTGGGAAYMMRTISVTAGHTYTFSALTYSSSKLNSLGYSFNTSGVSGGSPQPTVVNTWIPQSVTFTAATTETVTINVYSWATDIYSDDWLVVESPTVTPTVGTYTYTGSAQGPNTATNTGTGSSYTFSYAGVSPTVYAASSTQPTAAGTYSVTATVAANGIYTQTSSTATAFSIAKATPTLKVSNTPVTYDGTAKSATAT
ncbi:MAG: hypothetical protein WCJ61_12275, partial [Paludibacter sp.]